MKPIIRQTDAPPGLPDLRNLGTILRILVAVNAGVLVAGFALPNRRPAGMVAAWTQASAMVEPWLFVVLAVLWAASPWLARRPYRDGRGASWCWLCWSPAWHCRRCTHASPR